MPPRCGGVALSSADRGPEDGVPAAASSDPAAALLLPAPPGLPAPPRPVAVVVSSTQPKPGLYYAWEKTSRSGNDTPDLLLPRRVVLHSSADDCSSVVCRLEFIFISTKFRELWFIRCMFHFFLEFRFC